MNAVLHWIQAATGISPQAQASILVSLISAYGMNAIHLTKEHERSVLSALFWGLDGFARLLGRVQPLFNPQIQAEIQAGRDELSDLKSLVQAQQAQLDQIHAAVKGLKPAGTP
ncbi:MAG TPA: hypothetical protein VHX68_01600 [Planctomycetaceae bacterium]|jgi:hypothetical protein|nr:hypothetical protein [Planctomycetaceae bacterium]